jgi:hypothetical protein
LFATCFGGWLLHAISNRFARESWRTLPFVGRVFIPAVFRVPKGENHWVGASPSAIGQPHRQVRHSIGVCVSLLAYSHRNPADVLRLRTADHALLTRPDRSTVRHIIFAFVATSDNERCTFDDPLASRQLPRLINGLARRLNLPVITRRAFPGIVVASRQHVRLLARDEARGIPCYSRHGVSKHRFLIAIRVANWTISSDTWSKERGIFTKHRAVCSRS